MTALTPAAAAIVEVMEANSPLHQGLPAAEVRSRLAAMPAPPLPLIEVGEVLERRIPGPGTDIPVRIYRPPAGGPHAGVVYFHGGGFVIGSLDLYDRGCRALCRGTDAVVVSVDYRLAPEHPFPAPVLDADAARGWVALHAEELGIDPTRLAVAGDSAGGTLATVTARHARAATEPPLRAQLLVYPGTQLGADTASVRAYARRGYYLDRDVMRWFEACYLTGGAHGADDPDVSPLLDPDLRGMPPAYLVLPECDPLHDEGAAYAERLRAAEVEVTVSEYAGMFHGFFNLGHVLPEAADASAAAYDWLRDRLAVR